MSVNISRAPLTGRADSARTERPGTRGQAAAPFFLAGTFWLVLAGGLALFRQFALPSLPILLAWQWPLLHLLMVGGVSQLIIGGMNLFAATLLRTDAPPTWQARSQWLLVNVAAVGLAGGVLTGHLWLSILGGLALLATLGLLLMSLWWMRRRALVAPDPTFHYYEAAIVFLLIGAALGVLMLLGWSDSLLPRGQVRLAHLHLNLNGWTTLAIIGTMRLLFGTTLGRRATALNLLRWEFWPLAGGVAVSSFGWLVGSIAVMSIGSLGQLVGTVAYGRSIIRQWRASSGPRSLAARHLLEATGWLLLLTLGGVLGAAIRPLNAELAMDGSAAVATAGFFGFIGQSILGAWTHLFAVVAPLPTDPTSPLEAPMRPRLRAVMQDWDWLQLALANASVVGLVLSDALATLTPGIAAGLNRAGLVALTLLLGLIILKIGRVLWLVAAGWRARPA